MSEVKVVQRWGFAWAFDDDGPKRGRMGHNSDGEYVLHSDYAALAKRVEEFDEERRHHLDIREQRRNEVTRLREAAETSIRKCEQYWNEHNISDAEVHAALELIHGELGKALRADITTQSGDSGTKRQHLSTSDEVSYQGGQR